MTKSNYLSFWEYLKKIKNPVDMDTSIMCINILQNIKAVAPKLYDRTDKPGIYIRTDEWTDRGKLICPRTLCRGGIKSNCHHKVLFSLTWQRGKSNNTFLIWKSASLSHVIKQIKGKSVMLLHLILQQLTSYKKIILPSYRHKYYISFPNI